METRTATVSNTQKTLEFWSWACGWDVLVDLVLAYKGRSTLISTAVVLDRHRAKLRWNQAKAHARVGIGGTNQVQHSAHQPTTMALMIWPGL